MDIVVTHGDCGTGGGSGSQVNVGKGHKKYGSLSHRREL